MTELVCPRCLTSLQRDSDRLRCDSCDTVFPIVADIPDLRLSPDRYLSMADDRRKAERLAAVAGSAVDLVDAYWSMTPEVPPRLAASYAAATARSVARGAAVLERVVALKGTSAPRSIVDVGCGTGGLVVAAALKGWDAWGIDIALRWLVVAARLASDNGINATFAAADGALPPFRRRSFDVVTSVEALEHDADPQGTLGRSSALADSLFLAITANRWSVAPDPTLQLLFAGALPDKMRDRYVRVRRGTRAQFYRPLSASTLRSWLGPTGANDTMLRAALLPPSPDHASTWRELGTQVHDTIIGGPLERVVRPVAPLIEVSVRRSLCHCG